MSKVKVSRDVDGKQVEMEVEEADVLESDTLVTATHSSNEDKPKTFTQDEVNALLAKDRRANTLKFNTLQSQYDGLLKEVEDGKATAEEKAKAQVAELRKGLPEPVGKLLDKLTAQEQLEWLQEPANKIGKKVIPTLPKAREGKEEPNLGMAKVRF